MVGTRPTRAPSRVQVLSALARNSPAVVMTSARVVFMLGD